MRLNFNPIPRYEKAYVQYQNRSIKSNLLYNLPNPRTRGHSENNPIKAYVTFHSYYFTIN